jgi:hypothetical protein
MRIPVFITGAILLAFPGCNKTCDNCMSVAFRIRLLDAATGIPLENALVVAHPSQEISDTAHYSAVDTQYVIFGLPGTYSLEISRENYQNFSISGLTVGQWDQDQCDAHSNTIHMTIKAFPASAQKTIGADSASYKIVSSFVAGGC